MSDTDSFINEVTEEVRREQLYRYLRRYGWIGVLVVLLLVGGAAFNEYRKAQAASQAQATGDALLEALGENDPVARADAMADISVEGSGIVVTALLTAASQQEAGELDAAAATLNALAVNADVPDIYRDLAAFKAATLDVGDADTRRQTLDALAQPGGTFALLASEQLALIDLENGDQDAAIARLTAIIEDAGATRGLRGRAEDLMLALGADIPETPDTN